MNNTTDDRRVRKTKRALREGLSELMLEKELRDITVRELVDKSDIHRATFYVHYSDIYDLYEQMENEVTERINNIIVNDPTHSYDELFKTLIDYVYDNARMFRMFLMKTNNHSFQNRMSTLLVEKYLEIWKYETKNKKTTEEVVYLTNYHIQGCLSILSLWAEDNYNYSKEKITDIILKVDTNFDSLLY